jgi:uncharacterized protein YdeI (YjbR/CyaY-like superfamily)
MTELRFGLPVVSFADQTALESWLAEQQRDSKGAWILVTDEQIEG